MACKDCAELREEMNAKIAAAVGNLQGWAPSGRPAVRCGCGRFATVETKTTHPVAGTRVYLLCDHCDPPTLEFDNLRRIESQDFENAHWSKEDNAWARATNEALAGVCF